MTFVKKMRLSFNFGLVIVHKDAEQNLGALLTN